MAAQTTQSVSGQTIFALEDSTTNLRQIAIVSAQIITSKEGYVWSTRRLFKTLDGGQTWSEVTPPLPSSDNRLVSAVFLNSGHGWVLLSGSSKDGTVELYLASTHDSCKSWDVSLIPLIDRDVRAFSGNISVSFADPLHGWLLMKFATSSNFSFGALYRTTDGGTKWNRLPDPPSGGRIRYSSPDHGWLVGGPVGEKLYETRNAGFTWSPVIVQTPDGLEPLMATFDVPTFFSEKNGILLVTYTSPGRNDVAMFQTEDGGNSWIINRVQRLQARLGPGVNATAVPIPGSGFVLFEPSQGVIRSTYTTESVNIRESGISHGRALAVKNISVLDDSLGWLIATGERCEAGCLLKTEDGGRSWKHITPAAFF